MGGARVKDRRSVKNFRLGNMAMTVDRGAVSRRCDSEGKSHATKSKDLLNFSPPLKGAPSSWLELRVGTACSLLRLMLLAMKNSQ